MLALWKKSYDQSRQHIKKQGHYFANKGPSSQSCGFSSSCVWMWEPIKKIECWQIDAIELWCWRRLLRVPWTARRSNQSIRKEINPEYVGRLMLKLKFLPKKFQGWSPSQWTGWISLQSKELSGVFSNTTVQNHQFFSVQLSSQSNSQSIHDYWKNHSLD